MPSNVVGNTDPHPTGLISGGLDEKGEVTSVLVYRVQTEAAAASYMRGALHPELGLPEVSRRWTELEGCLGFDVSITYRGLPDTESDTDEYELDVSFSEEPIESHPNFDYIKKLYRGSIVDDEVVFQEYIRLTKKLNTKKGSKGFSKNPMFGVKTWLALKAVVRHTYTSPKRPNLSRIGKILKRVPGGFETPEDHDWLAMPPKCRRKGDRFQITMEYMLSPLGGWPEGVYELMEGRDDESLSEKQDVLDLGDEPFVPKTGWNL
jgi:hypothetical protein